MNKPLNTFRFKGIKITDWGSGKFSLEKSYKPKDSDVWKETKYYFKNELEELRRLIDQALMQDEESQNLIDKHQPEVSDELPAFDDQDIPF
jgi:hypothetical protein